MTVIHSFLKVAKEMEIVFPLWKNVSIHVGEMSQKLIAFALKLSATEARPCFLRPKAACPSPKKESVAHHLGTAQFGTNKGFFYHIKKVPKCFFEG